MLTEINNIYIFVPVLNYQRKKSKHRNITFDDHYCETKEKQNKTKKDMQRKQELTSKTTNFMKKYTLSRFEMYFVFKLSMMGKNTPFKLIYSPYSHQI